MRDDKYFVHPPQQILLHNASIDFYSRFHYRFHLDRKANGTRKTLQTELGPVHFTEELTSGFDHSPSPLSTAEAQQMICEAGRRYALLSAYTAAEKGVTLNQLASLTSDNNRFQADPKQVLIAYRRLTGEGPQKIINTLANTKQKDIDLMIKAAELYQAFLTPDNPHDTYDSNQLNLNYAKNILQGYNPEKDDPKNVRMTLDAINFRLPAKTFMPAQIILTALYTQPTHKKIKQNLAPHQTMLVKIFPAGITITFDENHGIEILTRNIKSRKEYIDSEWETQIRRTVKEDTRKLYVATFHMRETLQNTFRKLSELLVCAANFTKPLKF